MTPSEPASGDLSRREFLKRAIAGIVGVISAALGAGSGGYLLSPLFRRKEDSWIDVGASSGFAPGTPTKVEYIERKHDAWVTTERRSSAWVLTRDGQAFTVFDPRCTHLGCPYRWNADEKKFVCPCHNGRFGSDGQVISGPPPRALDRYPTKIVKGRLMILPEDQGPRAA
ncbi:MAG TPA: ubiquinol-cytochrome c reductase iron-sulfur subunit [Elusimicrobiota bacterium]|nr:ubiquinol-cytochrome c reductase iron-sulfur subunit [Elusimicrobiota bacterium]